MNILLKFLRYITLTSIIALPLTAQQSESDAAAQANNPLANSTSVNIQNYYIGKFTGVDRDANQLLFRAATPFRFMDSQWIARMTLPINTFPDGLGDTTGIGDFDAFAAYLFETQDPAISFGIGPQITIPTATDDVLGSDKWTAGFANVLFNAKSKVVQYGYLLTWRASFAGSDSAPDVNLGAFQPFVFYQLGNGWYARNTGVMVYDFESDDYTVPLGLGIGKVIPTDSIVYNIFVEPQYSLFDSGNSFPQWQVFAGFNTQF